MGAAGWAGIDEFIAVANAQSFSGGARLLGQSVSQTSRDIAALEERLAVPLLYRTTRQVSLTPAGQIFLEHCTRLIEARGDAIRAATAEQKAEAQGRLRITCAVAFGERFIVPLLNSFALQHPRVEFDIVLTDTVVDMVREGFDVAIRFGRMPDSQLIATRLTSRRRILCAAPAYLEAAGEPKTLGDLQAHSCLRGSADVWLFDNNGRPFSFKPSGRWRCNSGSAVLDAALRGLGICRMPDFYVSEYLRSGALVALLEDYRPEDEPVWLVRPNTRHLPNKTKALMSYLQTELQS